LESLIKKKTLTGLNKEQMKITPAQFQLMLNKKWKKFFNNGLIRVARDNGHLVA
jgi:hypothetical protein